MIENKRKQVDLIIKMLTNALDFFTEEVEFEFYNPILIKSGIDKFDNNKIYLDTSCIEGLNNILNGEHITYNKRPSRANMQPITNSIWFAKMKGSNKILLLTNKDKDIIDNCILSTGYQGLKETSNLPISLLTAIIISDKFRIQRDLNSVGTTMLGINNETFLKIKVPKLAKPEIKQFNEKYLYFVNKLSLYRREINSLQIIKNNLINKYFQ